MENDEILLLNLTAFAQYTRSLRATGWFLFVTAELSIPPIIVVRYLPHSASHVHSRGHHLVVYSLYILVRLRVVATTNKPLEINAIKSMDIRRSNGQTEKQREKNTTLYT